MTSGFSMITSLSVVISTYSKRQLVHYEWLSPLMIYYISRLHGSSERLNACQKVVEHVSMRWFNAAIKTELAGKNNRLKDSIKRLR